MTTDLVAQIDDRIAVLRDEAERLQAAREVLAQAQKADAPAERTPPPAPTNGKRRRGHNERVLELIGARPGITAAQIAEEIGFHVTYGYKVVKRLADRGRLKRAGDGWKLAE